MKLPAFPISGGCACGSVRYSLKARPLSVYLCHCKRCQVYGGVGTLAVLTRRSDVALSGAEAIRHGEPTDSGRIAEMFFCPNCHVRVYHTPADRALFTLMGGTLDDPTWLVPVAHIFTRSKQDGVLTGGTPCFDGPIPSRDIFYALFASALAGKGP